MFTRLHEKWSHCGPFLINYTTGYISGIMACMLGVPSRAKLPGNPSEGFRRLSSNGGVQTRILAHVDHFEVTGVTPSGALG